jgi:hypothetical protein
MRHVNSLDELQATGRMQWSASDHAWTAKPDEVMAALARAGFEECKREEARTRRHGEPAGGLWQGLDSRTGSVASAVWFTSPTLHTSKMFIEIDGEPVIE